MMKRLFMTMAVVMSAAIALAEGDVTKEKFKPFYTREEAPHLENVIPAPPTLVDPLFFNDWAQFQWGLSVRDSERGKQAVEDAHINATYFMKRYSEATDIELTPETHPELFRLFSRLHLTEQQAGASAKLYFQRVRPYQQYKEPSAVPDHENPTDFTSYPSGHTHASWLVGLTLVTLEPEHTEQIMKIAYELGQSRVIVGFHYQSDVDMGRIAGSITFARVMAEPEFQKQYEKAKKEYEKVRKEHEKAKKEFGRKKR
ncbi:MAG: phosphatase PAP2 family protein [Bacteroidaceae bacterium]|nr:phosphatase PAP2 family protein [Bacteroidaceae bacterium]